MDLQKKITLQIVNYLEKELKRPIEVDEKDLIDYFVDAIINKAGNHPESIKFNYFKH